MHRAMFVWAQTTKQKYKSNMFSDYKTVKIDISDLDIPKLRLEKQVNIVQVVQPASLEQDSLKEEDP